MIKNKSKFITGILCAMLCLILDQAAKLFLIFETDLLQTYPWQILPFMDITVVWNYGISYGFFQQNSEFGRWGLVFFKLSAAIFLFFWLMRVTSLRLASGIGLIMGGSIGNALDRMHLPPDFFSNIILPQNYARNIPKGAVFDFLHFHIGDFSWYVFNIADSGIVIGVALLFWVEFFPKNGYAIKKA